MQKVRIRIFARPVVLFLSLISFSITNSHGEDLSATARKAVEKSTLDQPGTRPFHLKAVYAPSFERDKGSNRVGEIEIWWASPTKWRREVRSPEFHQIAIVDGARQWQKNDGSYFPEWLRELAVATVQPIPIPMDVLQQRVKTAEVRRMKLPTEEQGVFAEQININWNIATEFGDAQSNGKGYLALLNGNLFYAGGPGFGGLYHDFKDFHGRMVAHTVASGSIEVTAKVNVLEDLGTTPSGFFDVAAPGGDTPLIDTVILDEAGLRKNVISSKPFAWPPAKDGPLEGGAGTAVVLDRLGNIREMDKPVSDNPVMVDAAAQGFRAMQFQPVTHNGIAVQVVAPLSVAFKTVRPAGVETFESARAYFEAGRQVSCLGAGSTAPYLVKAEFQVGSASGGVDTGRYEDTRVSATEWKREAWIGSSHLVRSQVGDKRYFLSEGPQAGLLRVVMLSMEPIPAGDTMTESDWRIRRDTVGGVGAIRVFRGPEGASGELDPKSSQGYWFGKNGQLLKSYVTGFEILPSAVAPFDGVQFARVIDVLKDGKLGMKLTVRDVGPVDPAVAKSFALKGHEWQRAFTAEVR
jgi:hypothetical protein